jgi:hypothetical protein
VQAFLFFLSPVLNRAKIESAPTPPGLEETFTFVRWSQTGYEGLGDMRLPTEE